MPRLRSTCLLLLLAWSGCGAAELVDSSREALVGVCVKVGDTCCQDSDCNDNDGCTADQCQFVAGLVLGSCHHAPVNDTHCCNAQTDCVGIPGCGAIMCEYAGNPWKDCVAAPSMGAICCSVADNCPKRACKTASCGGSTCSYAPTPAAPGCCANASDCAVANSCQQASCIDSQCVISAKVATGCCNALADCAGPNSCHPAVCEANQCVNLDLCTDGGGIPTRGDGGVRRRGDGGLVEVDAGPEEPSDGGKDDGPTTLRGGGGCAVAGAPSPLELSALFVLALFLTARSRRRHAA